MSATTLTPRIPEDWQVAFDQLLEWERSATITDEQWTALTDWLLNSPFGDKSFMAGELGARLMSERATDEVLDRFVSAPAKDSWVLHFQNVAAVGRNHPNEATLLEKARRDSNLIVRSFAISCPRFKPATSDID